MAKKQKKQTKKLKYAVEINIEKLLEFCSDVSEIFTNFDLETKYDFLTAIIGFETMGRSICKISGLDENTKNSIFQATDPIIDKVVECLQEDFQKGTTNAEEMQMNGYINPFYIQDSYENDIDNMWEDTIPKNHTSAKTFAYVGNPILFMDDFKRKRY